MAGKEETTTMSTIFPTTSTIAATVLFFMIGMVWMGIYLVMRMALTIGTTRMTTTSAWTGSSASSSAARWPSASSTSGRVGGPADCISLYRPCSCIGTGEGPGVSAT